MSFGGKEVNLRPYQQQLATDTLRALETHQRVAVVCPTGSGKTAMALVGILPQMPQPVAWLTHRTELAEQVAGYGVDVAVMTVQSSPDVSQFASIIIDEGHHVAASTYGSLISTAPHAKIIALTATPYRMDGVGLGACGFTALTFGPDIHDLTRSGFLCQAVTLIPVSESNGSWSPLECSSRIASMQFGKAIAYCRSVADCKETVGHLESRGVHAAVVESGMAPEDRSAAIRGFRAGAIRVLFNHSVLTEGFDCPEIDLVVLNRFTESRCLWRQMTGRGLRKAKGKVGCVILDLAANSATHGSIYDRELFTLEGSVERAEARDAPDPEERGPSQFTYTKPEELKIWKPCTSQILLLESLQRLKSTSPLRRLLTA
jgi:superfamily II DNA or RNA helicase